MDLIKNIYCMLFFFALSVNVYLRVLGIAYIVRSFYCEVWVRGYNTVYKVYETILYIGSPYKRIAVQVYFNAMHIDKEHKNAFQF